ncbi:MAG TPA: hypothetical protein VM681_08065 [Candidatus Thermoplasmatota archaeon]|nr:hypothetical protein [Candidatus Thermoplasmatota archaeon]
MRIEKAVVTPEEAHRGDRPGFEGFRCLSCRKLTREVVDLDGVRHGWREGAPATVG